MEESKKFLSLWRNVPFKRIGFITERKLPLYYFSYSDRLRKTSSDGSSLKVYTKNVGIFITVVYNISYLIA